MPRDRAGNSRRDALKIGAQSGKQVFKDWVGKSDRDDYYKLKLRNSSSLDMSLLRLKADADLELLNRKGKLISRSNNPKKSREKLNLQLEKGVYFVRVSRQGGNTNYKLRIRQTDEISASSPGSGPSPTSGGLSSIHPFISRVLDLTNFHRSEAGLAPLALDSSLNQAAQLHSEQMGNADFFSHTGADGSTPFDRIKATGYRYSSAAENIAAGHLTPEAVVEGWMNSPGHRANILDAKLQEIGIGYYFLQNDTGSINYNHYWTQAFATPFS